MARVQPGVRWALFASLLFPAAWFVPLRGANAGPGEDTSELQFAEQLLRKEWGIAAKEEIKPARLLKYFRDRTLSDQDRERLAGTVRRLGSSEFRVRQQAYKTLRAAGRAARPYLRDALADPDPEISRAAERLLKRIDAGTDLGTAVAVAQVLAARKPEGAVRVLLAYLPQAEEETVQEAVITALGAVGIKNGKADRLIVEAARSPEKICRLAAAAVLGKAGPGQRPILRGLLKDDNPQVRFQAAHSLVFAGDRSALPVLLALLGDGPIDLAWQAEDLLVRLAGDKAPPTLNQEDKAGRAKWRAGWEKWWDENETRVDLALLKKEKVLRGLTVIVEHDGAGRDGQGRIWERDRNGSTRWSIDSDLGGPLDVEVLPRKRILVGEYNRHRAVIREIPSGKVVWEKTMPDTVVSCQQLPNGHIFIATFTTLTEVDAKKNAVYTFRKPTSIYYARVLPNKHILYANSANQIVEVDAAGKELWSLTVPGSAWGSVEKLKNGHYLVALYGGHKVVEVDKKGTVFWECAAQSPTRAWRLPNGHTLVGCGEGRCVIEFDASGKKAIWTQKTQGRVWALRRY